MKESEHSHDLARLKKEYESLRKKYKKYKLPEFSQLNQEFEIEKIQEKETEFILRDIRHIMSEKIAAFLRFFETFLNPVTAPFFVLTLLKALSPQGKELVEKIYKELVNLELNSISLDISYNEEKEAMFIKQVMKKWQELKPELEEISETLKKIHSKGIERKKRTYFG